MEASVKHDRLALCEARCLRLELRDAERARILMKVRAKADGWRREAERQKQRADDADRNAAQWHALLLQERVRKLGDNDADRP